MPPRWMCWVIIAGWCATAAWFVRREILPHFATGGPPAFAIPLAEEALREQVAVSWQLSRNGERLAAVRSVVRYVEADDSFELVAVTWKIKMAGPVTVQEFRNTYRVTRGGAMLGVRTEVDLKIDEGAVRVTIAADVEGTTASPRCRIDSPWGVLEPRLEPIQVSGAGMLNPLHPVHRIQGLRPGMHWTVPLFDPLAEAQWAAVEGLVRSALGPQTLKTLRLPRPARSTLAAEVTGITSYDWHGRTEDCYVIEYRGDGMSAKTWVRVRDGTVLRQEAAANFEEFVLERDRGS